MKAHQGVRDIARKLIAKSILYVIEENKMNVRKLCRDAGISQTIYYNIINGKGYTIDSLLAVMQVLELHLEIHEKDIKNLYPDISEN
jgi:DNA-binding phage protein